MPGSLTIVMGTSVLVVIAAWPLLRYPRETLAAGLPLAMLPVGAAAVAGGLEAIAGFRRVADAGLGGADAVAGFLTSWTEGMLLAACVAVAITAVAFIVSVMTRDDVGRAPRRGPVIWAGFVLVIVLLPFGSAALAQIAERSSLGTLSQVQKVVQPPAGYGEPGTESPEAVSLKVARDLAISTYAGAAFVFTLLILVAFGVLADDAPPFAGRVALPAAACLSMVVLGWTAVRLSSAVTWLHGLADATNR